ncbi:MAG: hypothetical protein R3D25_18355 [Geminicoccaceae bacterium]
MLKRWSVIVGAAIVAVLGLWVYFAYRIPPGVEPMGDRTETIAWISLATSITGMLAAFAGLAQKLLELRKG